MAGTNPSMMRVRSATVLVRDTWRVTVRPLSMLDAIFLAAGVGFFVVAVLYVVACDWL
jgi:hypothetical protein